MSIQFLGVIPRFHQDPMSFLGAPSGSHPFLATLPIFAKTGKASRGLFYYFLASKTCIEMAKALH